MSKHLDGAILQRDKKTYAIVPRTPLGLVTPEVLDTIAHVVKKYEIPVIKITSGQRMALVGLQEKDVDQAWKDLGMDVGRATELCVHYVQACPNGRLPLRGSGFIGAGYGAREALLRHGASRKGEIRCLWLPDVLRGELRA